MANRPDSNSRDWVISLVDVLKRAIRAVETIPEVQTASQKKQLSVTGTCQGRALQSEEIACTVDVRDAWGRELEDAWH